MRPQTKDSALNSTRARFQPREKLTRFGAQNLTEVELLALLLRSGCRQLPLPLLAQKVWSILSNELSTPSVINDQTKMQKQLQLPGLGPAKTASILAILEWSRRRTTQKPHTVITQPQTVFQLATQIRHKKTEHALALYLNGQHALLDTQIIAIGGNNFAFLEPISIFHHAVSLPACGVVLVHNHPSGLLEPSDDDLRVTLRLKSAGALLGITLLDHVIVTNDAFYSLREHGAFET